MIVALLAVPLAGALLLLMSPARYGVRGAGRAERYVRAVGVLFSGVALLVAGVVAAGFDHRHPQRMTHVIDVPWAQAIGLRFHVGVDGVSLPLVVLTALLTFLCLLYLLYADRAGLGGRSLVGLVLLLEAGLLGTFVALDLLLFFMFFEAVLVPMYFMIGIRGAGYERGARAAADKFVLSMLFGSGVLLVGLMIIATKGGTLDMVVLARRHGAGLSHAAQVAAFLLVGLGFAVRVPMWPLHSWLPGAHTEAPIIGSVLLAGVLVKMGTYGLVRIALPMAPAGARTWAPWLGLLAVAGIGYGSLACLAQRELRRLIAVSSMGLMGFALLGIATLTPAGVNAALFGNIAHGLIIALLFFLAGSIEDRHGTADAVGVDGAGDGMLRRLPRLGSIAAFVCLAGLGVPGLAGFWGEILSLLAAYRPAPGLPRPAFVSFMAVGGLGVVLIMASFLRLLTRLTSGPAPAPAPAREPAPVAGTGSGGPDRTVRPDDVGARDVRPYEYAVFIPLVALTLTIGLWPKALLDLTDGPVRALLGGG